MLDNENQPIFKGKISKFGDETDAYGAPVSASVLPNTAKDAPTPLYPILYIARDPRCDLQIDTEVVCARFEDGTGIILGRADGNYTSQFPGNVTFKKGGLDNGDVNVEENVRVKKEVVADTDVKGASISLKGHTHGDAHGGETTGPH